MCGGEVVKLSGRCANGMFIQPTIIEGLDIHCRTNQEEIFGPVVTITPFNTDEEALMLANNSVYGLASVIWTQDLTRAHRMADAIESGIVWINCWLERDLRTPFGGMKQSGVGREGGWEALRFLQNKKYNHSTIILKKLLVQVKTIIQKTTDHPLFFSNNSAVVIMPDG